MTQNQAKLLKMEQNKPKITERKPELTQNDFKNANTTQKEN